MIKSKCKSNMKETSSQNGNNGGNLILKNLYYSKIFNILSLENLDGAIISKINFYRRYSPYNKYPPTTYCPSCKQNEYTVFKGYRGEREKSLRYFCTYCHKSFTLRNSYITIYGSRKPYLTWFYFLHSLLLHGKIEKESSLAIKSLFYNDKLEPDDQITTRTGKAWENLIQNDLKLIICFANNKSFTEFSTNDELSWWNNLLAFYKSIPDGEKQYIINLLLNIISYAEENKESLSRS